MTRATNVKSDPGVEWGLVPESGGLKIKGLLRYCWFLPLDQSRDLRPPVIKLRQSDTDKAHDKSVPNVELLQSVVLFKPLTQSHCSLFAESIVR